MLKLENVTESSLKKNNVTVVALVVAVTVKTVTATATMAKNATVAVKHTKKSVLAVAVQNTQLKQPKKQQNNQPVLRTNTKLAMDKPIASFI